MSEDLTITLPDGSQKSVPAGSSPLDIAKSIGARLADDAVVARVDGELWDLTRPFEKDAKLEILTSKNPEALQVYRHSTAHLLAAAVLELFPETKLGIGPPTDTGFYYDFQRETPFTPEDLEKIEARMRELQAKNLPFERVHDAQGSGPEEIRGRLDEARADRRARRRNFLRVHAGAAFHRLLPRAARAVHHAHQGVQAAVDRRRLLEGRRAQPAPAAHLRHRVLQQEGPGRLSRAAGRSQEARSSQARPGAGPVQHSGTRRTGTDFLPSQGRPHSQDHRRLDARSIPGARLLAGLHAARDAARSVEDLRPRQFLQRKHVQAHGAGRRRVSAQAHELPGPHSDLSRQAAQLSRSAGAAGRTGNGVSLRAHRASCTA